MTSNLGAKSLQTNSSLGFRAVGDSDAARAETSYEIMKEKVAAELKNNFRPEFLNRIDEIVEFHPLSKEQIGEIVELQLRRVEARLAERGLRLELTDAAKDLLGEAGWDPTYGARPLKRAIQRLLENPLAMRLLESEFAEGDVVRVDGKDGELSFQKAAAAEPAAA